MNERKKVLINSSDLERIYFVPLKLVNHSNRVFSLPFEPSSILDSFVDYTALTQDGKELLRLLGCLRIDRCQIQPYQVNVHVTSMPIAHDFDCYDLIVFNFVKYRLGNGDDLSMRFWHQNIIPEEIEFKVNFFSQKFAYTFTNAYQSDLKEKALFEKLSKRGDIQRAVMGIFTAGALKVHITDMSLIVEVSPALDMDVVKQKVIQSLDRFYMKAQ